MNMKRVLLAAMAAVTLVIPAYVSMSRHCVADERAAASASCPAPLPAGAASSVPACRVQTLWICKDTPFATPYYIIDSGKPGPVVMVVGGVHGDEIAGSTAAREISSWSVRRGRLVVLPQANRQGVDRRTRTIPAASTQSVRDLNRDFPMTASELPQGELATGIWAVVQSLRPEWLVDLHEGLPASSKGAASQPGAATRHSVAHSIICSRGAAVKAAASLMAEDVNRTILLSSEQFTLKWQPIGGSLARGAFERLGTKSMIVETSRNDAPISRRSRQHRMLVHRLLQHLDMDSSDANMLAGPRNDSASLRVAVYDDDGVHAGPGLDRLLNAGGDMAVYRVGSVDLDAGVLKQFHVLVVPGGTGSTQSHGLGATGKDAIREFVKSGGGYVGMCAGAYLATNYFKWSLGILNADVIDHDRGRDTVKLDITPMGREILGQQTSPVDVKYHNGPILGPGDLHGARYEVLAIFRSEVVNSESPRPPKAKMDGTPAIVCGQYVKGRIIITSPHPEATSGLEEVTRRMVRWAGGR